jgi:hypothetical protein
MNDYFFSSRPGFPWSLPALGLPALGAVAVLLGLFTIWTYLGHPQATRRRVLVVLGLRLAALAVALLTAVRPSVGVNENPKQPSTLIVSVDASKSMTVTDALGGQARIDAVRKTLEKCRPLLDDLEAERGVATVIYKFGPPDFSEAAGRWDPAAPADADRSDYGALLNRTFERWQTERVRAHLVIGDGGDNGEAFSAQAEAARWGRRGVPVYTFLVGNESSTLGAKDVVVTAVECDPSPAYIKNKVTVTARVNAYNFPGAEVTARVSVNDRPEPDAQRNFTLDREKNNELKIPITAPEKPGEYKIKVEVGILKGDKLEPLPGELSPLNNWSETYLTVLKEGVRVLIVDQLRFEETFLREALQREKRFNVSEVFRQTELTPSAAERELLKLEDQAYDVVIIGNVSAEHLNRGAPEFLPRLTELVEKRGVGVMFLGGEFAFRGIPEALLPVVGGPIVDKLDNAGNPTVTYPTLPTVRGLEQMFRVSGKPGEPPKAGESEELWERMNSPRAGRQLSGYNRLTVPNAGLFTVYARTGDPNLAKGDGTGDPLLVGSERGDRTKGRWLAFGAYDTYFWRDMGQPKSDVGVRMHERFWRQCVLWLAHQDEAEGAIEVIPQFRQLKVGQELAVRMRVKRPSGDEDPTAALTVRVLPLAPGAAEPKPEDEAKAVPLTVLTDADTPKSGRKVLFRPAVAGEYFVAVTSPVTDAAGQVLKNPDGTPKLNRGTAKFIAVPDVSDEMLQVNASPAFMQSLATPTGGKALRLEDLPTFLAELKAEAPPDAGKKPRYYPDWHRNKSRGFLPLWLTVFTLLLGAEWGLRRLWGMV